MSEVLKAGGACIDPSDMARPRDTGDVVSRGVPYKYAQPAFDIDRAIANHLGLEGSEFVVDVGSHRSDFLTLLYTEHQHMGELVGVEPLENGPIAMGSYYLHQDFLSSSITPEEDRLILGSQQLRVLKSLAQELPGDDNTVDVLTARMMMYCIPEAEQAKVLEEFVRVLKPEGRAVISTSGPGNKAKHRVFERAIADYFGITAPELMNREFDTGRAETILPDYFRHIYHLSYRGKMVFRNVEEADAYYRSLVTMAPYYQPSITAYEMTEAIADIVVPEVERQISRDGAFFDFIEKDVFFCSNDPEGLNLAPLNMAALTGPERILGYTRREIS